MVHSPQRESCVWLAVTSCAVLHWNETRMKFVHTADLQIGARFAQFGDNAETLRTARVTALGRGLEIAKEESADAVLIAGDMFEDNQIGDDLVRQERILDYLPQILTDVQVLVLTCHSSMYRGVGHSVDLDAGVAS